MTRLDAWSRNSLGANFMLSDLRRGQALGQFDIDDAATLTDFLMGASAGGIQGLRSGVADPHAYMDASVRATMRALGASLCCVNARSIFLARIWRSGRPGGGRSGRRFECSLCVRCAHGPALVRAALALRP